MQSVVVHDRRGLGRDVLVERETGRVRGHLQARRVVDVHQKRVVEHPAEKVPEVQDGEPVPVVEYR